MNFYQSKLRKIINKEIYKKPTFGSEFSWEQLFWITKSQKKIGKTLNWYMIHGVETDLEANIWSLQEEIAHTTRDFKKSRGDIFFQYWCVHQLGEWETDDIKKNEKLIDEIKEKKVKLNTHVWEKYNMVPSWREHMPDATILMDLKQSWEELKAGYSRSCKRYINKAKKQKLTFVTARKEQWKQFRKIRYEMSYDKWFSVLPEKLFLELMMYITQSDQGDLFLAMRGEEILSGSVMLWIEKDMYYLYGATNRAYGDIWWHYWLKNEIFNRAIDEWYVSCDLLWVAPPYHTKWHYLEWVTRFKQSFGGKTILYSWNYDLVYNAMLYRLMQALKK